jgi:hypothetical protein
VSQATLITLIIAGLFAFLGALALLRIWLRSEYDRWQRYRVGVFIERDPERSERDEG